VRADEVLLLLALPVLMVASWAHSPIWILVVIVAAMFSVGVVVPLEIATYAAGHQKAPVDESLESSFRISYKGQWSGFGNHWYNYTVTFAAAGLQWGDLWITVYFNGTTSEISPFGAEAVVNNGTLGVFNFLAGRWGPVGAVAHVQIGQTLSVNTGGTGGDGNILYISAAQGSYFGSLSLVIP
jgi:hypothetical protein